MSQFLVLVAYHKFISMNFSQIEATLDIRLTDFQNDLLVGGISFLFSFVELKQMTYFSQFFSTLAISVALYVLTYLLLVHSFQQSVDLESETYHVQVTSKFELEQPVFPGLACFLSIGVGLYEGIPIVPKIYSNTANKSNFLRICLICLLGIASMTLAMGVLGVLTYGQHTQEIIL